jgi:hypothetical protein
MKTPKSQMKLPRGAFVFATGISFFAACGGGKTPAAAPAESSAGMAAVEKSPLGGPKDESAAASSAASPAGSVDAPAGPIAQVLETDPAAIRKIYDAAKSAPGVQWSSNETTRGDALSKGIHDIAMRLPAGMKPDGPLGTGTLQAKHHLQTNVSLQPGKCYSIVGYSKKVKDLDLYLFMPPGILSGQDLSDDNRPVIGGPPQPMCPVGATALTYVLDIFADSGAGEVAVQLYSKSN